MDKNKIVPRETDWILFEKFRKTFFGFLIDYINIKRKIPISLVELVLPSDYEAILIGLDSNHPIPNSFFVKFSDDYNISFLVLDDSRPLSYDLKKDFTLNECEIITHTWKRFGDFFPTSAFLKKYALRIIKDENIYVGNSPGAFIQNEALVNYQKQYFAPFFQKYLTPEIVLISLLMNLDLKLHNYYDLAIILNYFFHQTNLLFITEKDVIKLLSKLGLNYKIENSADDDSINAIITVWIELQYDDYDRVDNDAWV